MTDRPQWLPPTPRMQYAKGVDDAALYIVAGRDVVWPEPTMTLSKSSRAFWAGMTARFFGVHLQRER